MVPGTVDLPAHRESRQVHLHHDRDLIHELIRELSHRLNALGRYDQYIANAKDRHDLQIFWIEMKARDASIVEQLNGLVRREIQQDCFR